MSEEELSDRMILIINGYKECLDYNCNQTEERQREIKYDIETLETMIDLYNKEKEKNKELKEQLRKANEYIRNEMYIDDNPTICGDQEDTITELPISLNLYNEGLRELLELLEERN